MDAYARTSRAFGSRVFPDPLGELRWEESVLWPVRRPYPIEIACPVCGSYARCGFFGRVRCPRGHEFGQRAFWTGFAATCDLLVEDLRDGRMHIYRHAPLHWHDDARHVPGRATVGMAERREPVAPLE